MTRIITPADRDLTPIDRRLKCLHGIPLNQDCPDCKAGRPSAAFAAAPLFAEVAD